LQEEGGKKEEEDGEKSSVFHSLTNKG
jgi:hypothetical protein